MSARSLEAHLHEPRRFTQLACGGYPPLSLSLPTLQSALRLHLLPEPYLPRGDTPLRRRGLSHVCPFVGACDSGGLCHRAVLCRYQQCRDGSRKPRPLTRLLDRGQSTESSRSLLVTSQLTLPLAAVQPVGLHRHGSLLPRVPLPVRQLRGRDQPAPPTRLRV